MSGNLQFARGLSSDFMRELKNGPVGAVFQACRSAGLDLRLRNNYLNAYDAGRSVAKLLWGSLAGVRLLVHHKYIGGSAIGQVSGRRGKGPYVRFRVDARFSDLFEAELPAIRGRADAHKGKEEHVEDALLRANRSGDPVVCLDRQTQAPGSRRKMDVVAIVEGSAGPVFVVIEVKRDLDNSIQEVPRQVHRYLEILDPDGTGLRPDVASSYRRVCEQMLELGLDAPDPSRVKRGMPLSGLVVLALYNDRSQLLPRAHAAAVKLPRPIHYWLAPSARKMILPGPEKWDRLGTPMPS